MKQIFATYKGWVYRFDYDQHKVLSKTHVMSDIMISTETEVKPFIHEVFQRFREVPQFQQSISIPNQAFEVTLLDIIGPREKIAELVHYCYTLEQQNSERFSICVQVLIERYTDATSSVSVQLKWIKDGLLTRLDPSLVERTTLPEEVIVCHNITSVVKIKKQKKVRITFNEGTMMEFSKEQIKYLCQKTICSEQ